jgi:phosphoribosylanthranilate isomerase
MQIKVCGITTMEQLLQLENSGADYAGFIFYSRSKRYVSNHFEKDLEKIRKTQIKKVGVFVDQNYEAIVKAIEDYGLHAIQLHGDETDEFCLELMGKVKVIKVFRMGNDHNVDSLVAPFMEVCDYFLFDTDTSGYGGSGKKFNWGVLQNATIDKPFFLSGGIGPDDLANIQSFEHPYLHAIDVNSRFETEPGYKDMDKVADFIQKIKNGKDQPG